MSGSRELAEHVCDQLAPLGPVVLCRFFGGFALERAGAQFAIVMDTLYFCVDDCTREAYAALGSQPFAYRAAGRRVSVQRYYSAPEDALDDADRLAALARDAIAAARRVRGSAPTRRTPSARRRSCATSARSSPSKPARRS